ncbi:DUF2062 domain-containing protein [Desulfosarcina ovata]|uniref:DUF2062 domain-containing protein n=1 Tax=Desulfosarcina ovata subsp. ovata TaxID=2752305 RepID=A0A5K8AK61_9BACT|nr:DUF2062 domain-containing protein [Desulfosarcina ovata]BBO93113.1 hypothetical protein DSCOOX_62930 [Desulfosarcina ovata subsp. ovata]
MVLKKLSTSTSAQSIRIRIWRRLTRIQGAPREIALGFSLGIMIGMTPFWGTHVFLSLGLASLLGWSRISAIAGVNITNVVTAPLIYPLNYWVGIRLVGFSEGARWPAHLDASGMLELITQSPRVLADLSIGGIILAIPLAVGGYILVYRGILLYRRR